MIHDWTMKHLSEVCVLDKSRYVGNPMPYIGMEDIESGTGKFLGSLIPEGVKSSSFRFDHRHILYGRLRPYLNKVFLPDFEGHCSTEIFPLLPQEGIDRKFLYYWLISDRIVNRINDTCTGARMPRANMNAVMQFELAVPPLPQQKRIAAILDEAFEGIDAAIANTEKNLVNARHLFEGFLNSKFSVGSENWESKQIHEIAEVKGGKRVPKGYKLETNPTDHPYITVSDFNNNGGVDLENIRYVSDEVFDQISRYTISQKDLYISIAGTIGKTGIIPSELEGANLTENACKLVFGEGVNNQFVYYFTKTASFKEQAIEQTRIAAQPKLALSRLKTISLRVPNLAIQKQQVQRFKAVEEEVVILRRHYENKIKCLKELKQSILNRAFSGELTKKAA